MHIVLAGDSIFDNGAYVPDGPALVDVLRSALGDSGKATLLAVDGSVSMMVPQQLRDIPKDADRLFISSGGNDALACRFVIDVPSSGVPVGRDDEPSDAVPLEELPLASLGAVFLRNVLGFGRFREALRSRLEAVAADPDVLARARPSGRVPVPVPGSLDAAARTRLPTCVCTIYDRVPGLPPRHRAALAVFNDVILSEAAARGLQVIDLRNVCTEAGDYAESSPIEPSLAGSWKIVERILRAARDPALPGGPCRVYA